MRGCKTEPFGVILFQFADLIGSKKEGLPENFLVARKEVVFGRDLISHVILMRLKE